MKTEPYIVRAAFVGLAALCCMKVAPAAESAAGEDWPYYHGNPAGTHYSSLKEIHTGNVGKLELAWTYDTKDKTRDQGDVLAPGLSIESNPLVVGGQLFFLSPMGRLISLDGASGRERWTFKPAAAQPTGWNLLRRGVSYWSDGQRRRVLFTYGEDLYSVDAETGQLDARFGDQGRVPLGARVASPGVIYNDLIIVGGSVSRIRAFDVRTGRPRWTFHTIPRPGEFGYDTWPKNAWKTATGAHNWAGMALDEKRGMVFVPLAMPYNSEREGDNLFGNCLLALEARTGRRLWHFQVVRHDLWDRDLPAPPTLVTVRRGGQQVDAVAQVTKQGFVYVLDRLTGASLFPLVEVGAIASDIPGEKTAATQPHPQLPAPFTRQHLTAEMLTQRTPQAAAAAAAEFASLRSRGLWDPPSLQGTILFPGFDGGAEWGGAAFDPETASLYVNANEIAWIYRLKKLSFTGGTSGAALYRDHCAGCHGENREGRLPDFPSLVGVTERFTPSEIMKKVTRGGGRMPAFPSLGADQRSVWLLIEYLRTGVEAAKEDPPPKPILGPVKRDDYVLESNPRFVDPDGYPAIAPPWGTLNAINLDTGQYAWKIPLGEYPELVAHGMKDTGSENYGGPIVTAGGLLFIGATSFDKKFRAYDKGTGELLWETTLPAAGNATPATYRANGRQYVVIPAGGGRPPQAESGSKILAFTIPTP